MKFSDLLQILKKALRPEITNPDFMTYFFGAIMNLDDCDDDDSKFFLLTKKQEQSLAGKIFNGSAPFAKKKAQIAFTRMDTLNLKMDLEKVENHVVEVLVQELKNAGLSCNEKDYSEKIIDWIEDFIKEAANSEAKKGKSVEDLDSQGQAAKVIQQVAEKIVNIDYVENLTL